jgi:hypothetical protein
MTAAPILLPVFAEVALTFGLLLWLGGLRVPLIRRRGVRMSDIALGEPNWPPHVIQVQNAFQNQLELPVLFYALVALALVTERVTVAMVVLAWLFVALRGVHALIHTTSNNVPRRFFVYALGFAVLMLMWLLFFVSVVFQ